MGEKKGLANMKQDLALLYLSLTDYVAFMTDTDTHTHQRGRDM